jgi:hypothetical protein
MKKIRNVYSILVRNSVGKESLGRLRLKKIVQMEVDCEDDE